MYCIDYCPDGYTGTKPNCTLNDANIFCQNFEGFANQWTENGITLEQKESYPAKMRGNHFNGYKNGSYMLFKDTFKLNFDFTLYMWIRKDMLDNGDESLFSKTSADGVTELLNWWIEDETAKMLFDMKAFGISSETTAKYPSDDSNALVLPEKKWILVGLSLNLNNDAVTSTLRFWKNKGDGTNDNEQYTESIANLWLDAAEGSDYIAVLGAIKDGADKTNLNFTGFIYSFCIKNVETMTASFMASSCTNCDSGICVSDDAHCLGDWEFTEYESGKSCHSSCNDNDIGCVKPFECQTCTFKYCHLCYDRECVLCDNYSDCNTDECEFSKNAQESGGDCTCKVDNYRSVTNPEWYQCKPCHGEC
jgi:hypothetical protein